MSTGRAEQGPDPTFNVIKKTDEKLRQRCPELYLLPVTHRASADPGKGSLLLAKAALCRFLSHGPTAAACQIGHH